MREREKQVAGNHYKAFRIQPWDIIDEYRLSFYEGNVLKYLLRTKTNRLEDLKKCRHYVDKLIEDMERHADVEHLNPVTFMYGNVDAA